MAHAFTVTTRDVRLCVDTVTITISSVIGRVVHTTARVDGKQRKTAAMAAIAVSPQLRTSPIVRKKGRTQRAGAFMYNLVALAVFPFTITTREFHLCVDTATITTGAVVGKITSTTAGVESTKRKTAVMAVAVVSSPRRKSPAVTMKARTTLVMGVYSCLW